MHHQRPLPRPRARHTQPPLKHAEHRARPGALIRVADGGDAATGFPGVIVLPVAGPDGIVDAAEAVAVGFPALDASTVDMWTKGEAGVAWFLVAGCVRGRRR